MARNAGIKKTKAVHWQRNKWNESGFRPPLCTYRLNWSRRTSWGWWDEWDDTVLQTQDSKFKPWWSEAEHATFWSRRLPTILTFTRRWGRNIFVPVKPPRPGAEPRTLAWKAAVLTTTSGPPPWTTTRYKTFRVMTTNKSENKPIWCVYDDKIIKLWMKLQLGLVSWLILSVDKYVKYVLMYLNQSINQLINYSINQSINRLINPPTSWRPTSNIRKRLQKCILY